MNDQLARQYVLSRLDDGQFSRLYEIERFREYCIVPAGIHERFNTARWGDVDEESQAKVLPVVMGIFSEFEAQAVAKGEFRLVETQHMADVEIRRRGLDFGAQKKIGSAKAAMRVRQEQEPVFEEEIGAENALGIPF